MLHFSGLVIVVQYFPAFRVFPPYTNVDVAVVVLSPFASAGLGSVNMFFIFISEFGCFVLVPPACQLEYE